MTSVDRVYLLAPAVAIGNCGQLAIDLILEKAAKQGRLERLGLLRSRNVHPIIGNDPISPASATSLSDSTKSLSASSSSSASGDVKDGSMVTAIETYRIHSDSKKNTMILVIQIRSPIVLGRFTKLAEELLGHALSLCPGEDMEKKREICTVLQIGGADATFRIEDQIRDTRMRYVCSKASSKQYPNLSSDLSAIDIIQLESILDESNSLSSSLLISASSNGIGSGSIASSVSGGVSVASKAAREMKEAGYQPIKRAGMTPKMLSLCDRKGISMIGFIMFLREGWNIIEAETMATKVNSFLDLGLIGKDEKSNGWIYPPSWEELIS